MTPQKPGWRASCVSGACVGLGSPGLVLGGGRRTVHLRDEVREVQCPEEREVSCVGGEEPGLLVLSCCGRVRWLAIFLGRRGDGGGYVGDLPLSVGGGAVSLGPEGALLLRCVDMAVGFLCVLVCVCRLVSCGGGYGYSVTFLFSSLRSSRRKKRAMRRSSSGRGRMGGGEVESAAMKEIQLRTSRGYVEVFRVCVRVDDGAYVLATRTWMRRFGQTSSPRPRLRLRLHVSRYIHATRARPRFREYACLLWDMRQAQMPEALRHVDLRCKQLLRRYKAVSYLSTNKTSCTINIQPIPMALNLLVGRLPPLLLSYTITPSNYVGCKYLFSSFCLTVLFFFSLVCSSSCLYAFMLLRLLV